MTARGANARVKELFSAARAIEVAGYNDIEMGRDVIDLRSSGDRARIAALNPITFPLNLSAGVQDQIIVETDDGAGGTAGPHTLTIAGSYADIVDLVAAINSAWRTAGGSGTLASSWGVNRVLFHSWSAVPEGALTHLDSKLKLVEPALRSAWAALGFQAAQISTTVLGTSGIVFSSMPGGILRPNTLYGEFTPATDKRFHIGGATDVYVRPDSSDEDEASLPDVEDEVPAWIGTKLTANPVITTSDRIKDEASVAADARPGRPDFTGSLSVTALDLKYSPTESFDNDLLQGGQVLPGDVVTLRSGSYGGSYMVAATQTQDPVLDTNDLRVSSLLQSFGKIQDINYHVSVATRIRLTAPKRRVKISSIHGTQLQCYGASSTVSWLGTSISKIDTNNFARYGVAKGDKIRIWHQINGEVSENAGVYTIINLSSTTLELDEQMLATEVVAFQVYEETGDPLDLPLVRIRSVNLLDALGASTGDTVPYALPVLIQSQGLSGGRTVMEGTNGVMTSASSTILAIPATYRSFTEMGVKADMVVTLKHSTLFGSAQTQTFAKIRTVADFSLTFYRPVNIGSGLSATDVLYTIGPPARGTARMYFQEPISFEAAHQYLEHSFDPLNSIFLTTPDVGFLMGVRNDDGSITNYYEPRSKGILGGRRIYPALESGEDPEQSNVDVDSLPTFAQDNIFVWTNNLAAVLAKLDFSTFVSRQYGLLPADAGQVQMGDVVMLYPERLLGFGNTAAYTSALVAERDWYVRKLFSVAEVPVTEANHLLIPYDSFGGLSYAQNGLTDSPSTVSSVEGAFGQLEGSLATIHAQPDSNPTPNSGKFRVDIVPVDASGFSRRLPLKRPGQLEPFSLEPTDPMVEACGRSSADQTIITVAAGAGDYTEGETITNGSAELVVDYWDPATNKIYAYGDYKLGTLPGAGNWVGAVSGTTRAHSSYATYVYLFPNDATQVFTFTGGAVAPGWISATNPGPWEVGNFVYLFGIFTTTPTIAQCTGAYNAMGTWKITAVNGTGTSVTVESVTDVTKLFDNSGAGNSIGMGWVISEGTRPLEHFGVYEAFPTPFPVESILYEDGGIQEGRLQLHDPQQLFLDYTAGRAYSGVLCPCQISRPGRIRISSTEMSRNTQDGLYFFDVEVESRGPEEENNLGIDTDMVLTSAPDPVRGAWRGLDGAYCGEGYVLEVADPNFTYSVLEQVILAACPRILPADQDDLEPNKVLLDARSLSVAYDHSDLIENIDALLNSDGERVTSASLLARHFTPAFVRLILNYSGLGIANEILADIQEYVDNLTGSSRLEVSDIEGLVHKRGADFIDQDFALVALFHDQNRAIVGERSDNFIGGDEDRTAVRRTTNRVSHFVTDSIVLNKL
ncbi:MAG: hypothetical protein KDB07_01830 [Planctomycetes bacterium]|nr:hypothetical protein [Planctomycetota bacterium]